MMAKRDPWTNMLRTTAACAGAAFGGADAVTVLPYTWALGAPDRFARRIARNTQLVLQEESALGRVVDPAGGSWYVEQLTSELAAKAWALFQGIEAKGGIASALTSGALQDEIARVAEERAKAVATGRRELTGVSVFPMLGEDGVKVAPNPAPPPLTGTQHVRPLTPHRLTEPFEALRDAADVFLAKTGARPRIFLANLGEIVEHNTRSTWVWNFLAAGGIEGLNSDGYASADAAAAAFKTSGARIACLCSSDAVYAKEAQAAAKALKAAGAGRVLMAGRPGPEEALLRSAGVDGFLFAGQDAIAVLADLHKALGVG
jgi:methylmalonyl-CoA mutase